ncbi:MAG: FtsX-like permease family protein [Candidatus Electryoneaceae bacterium]|nr:FtsX-like permease family protein [Candidatus Electryoneaceae bacterium]
MICFLLKGLMRDRSRSLFPVLVVSLGVMLTVFMQSYLQGAMGDIIRSNANFSTGHVKIMSKAYAENRSQIPNDLALMGVDELLHDLRLQHPEQDWVERIRFGGLLDIPDENGETRAQGTVVGLAVDLLSPQSPEIATLNIQKAIVRGRLPDKSGEILISDEFATKLKANPGDEVTLISSTMHGSMSLQNFTISGTVRFGITAMDKGAMLVDISDIRKVLDMDDAAGELLGYFRDGIYNDKSATEMTFMFNEQYAVPDDEYAPVMFALRDQDGLGEYLSVASYFSFVISGIFVFAMSIVLWNVGLIGGLRRYGEMGLRLAIGENKGHVYGSLITEAMLVGIIGSVVGTTIGIGFAYYLQVYGFDLGAMMENSSMMISNIMRAKITTTSFFIGFIPGVLSTMLGAVLSGRGIYKRQTAQLFKELES